MREFDDLSREHLERMIDVLGPFVSAERRARIEAAIESRTRDLVIVLEDIFNPHNASAVMRTAEALGVLEVHGIQRRHRLRVSRRVSSGAHKWLDAWRWTDPVAAVDALRARGYSIFAAELRDGAVPISDIDVERPARIALLFGNEHDGLGADTRALVDGRFFIPMRGFVESLNVSVAAAIAMYDVMTRRQRVGRWDPLLDDERTRLRAAWYAMSVRAARQIIARGHMPVPPPSAPAYELLDDDEPSRE